MIQHLLDVIDGPWEVLGGPIGGPGRSWEFLGSLGKFGNGSLGEHGESGEAWEALGHPGPPRPSAEGINEETFESYGILNPAES